MRVDVTLPGVGYATMGMKQRLRYQFDHLMSRGVGSQMRESAGLRGRYSRRFDDRHAAPRAGAHCSRSHRIARSGSVNMRELTLGGMVSRTTRWM